MTTQVELSRGERPALDDCWNRIGVRGDGSCPELTKVLHCFNCPVFATASQRLFERAPPPACVEEWTRELARNDADKQGSTAALLLFRLGEEWLALDVCWLIEATEPRVIHRIPHRTSRLLLGLVNIRGELQLCVSLRELLGVEGPAATEGRLLVAEHEGRRWVFAVDEVAGVEHLPLEELTRAPSTVAQSPRRFARGVFSWKERRVGYLAAEPVFAALRGHIG